MGTIDISYTDLLLGLLLLSIPIYFLKKYNTSLVRSTLVGTVRMCIQLFLIGFYLRYLFEWNNPLVNGLWVVMMVVVAAYTAVSRMNLKKRVMLLPVAVGFLFTAIVIGFYFLGCVLRLDNVFLAQYFIPIFGIVMGNMLTVNVVAISTYYDALKREQSQYYYLLGNGATRSEATAPFIRAAIVKAFSPCIANMAVMGLVSLPGTMIGQILGGSMPGVAIKYQMMIIVITFTASMMSLIIAINLSARNSFDAYGRIKNVER